jgi:hypothetical protein
VSAAAEGPRRVVLSVPGLDGPPLTGGCCATAREDVLLEELDSWPGLLALDVDAERGVAAVLVTPGHRGDLTAALEALADRGLPAIVMDDTTAGP